ncbi:MAG: phosphoglycerate dehydrogenase, partial [Candidatus Omnitrophica bacterium]|nr:phosphoglycerate dehydrogenase [Candidatus Omnitrophota bacterium]
IKDADFLIAGTEQLSRDVLDSAKRLKAISRCGTGLDNVDLAAAEQNNIKVFNTPDAPTRAVAELTVGLILALIRHIPVMDRDIRGGVWKKRMGNLLEGKCVGIIGFGRIGRKTAELLLPFGVKIVYYDVKETESSPDHEKVGLDRLLENADIISMHLSVVPGGEPVIGKEELKKMKEGSLFVNASRGGSVDEKALAEAIETGHIAGAALDVFKNEPYDGPLVNMKEVILTPHIGSYAVEARISMETEAVQNLLKGIKGREK